MNSTFPGATWTNSPRSLAETSSSIRRLRSSTFAFAWAMTCVSSSSAVSQTGPLAMSTQTFPSRTSQYGDSRKP